MKPELETLQPLRQNKRIRLCHVRLAGSEERHDPARQGLRSVHESERASA